MSTSIDHFFWLVHCRRVHADFFVSSASLYKLSPIHVDNEISFDEHDSGGNLTNFLVFTDTVYKNNCSRTIQV